jgi:hydroxymethylglutaryl-CoA reductase
VDSERIFYLFRKEILTMSNIEFLGFKLLLCFTFYKIIIEYVIHVKQIPVGLCLLRVEAPAVEV